jgi:hypothetical protein
MMTPSAYVIADEGSTAIYIAMHRVLANPTSPKKHGRGTPHIRRTTGIRTPTAVYKGHHTTRSACVARRCGCLVRMQYRALM